MAIRICCTTTSRRTRRTLLNWSPPNCHGLPSLRTTTAKLGFVPLLEPAVGWPRLADSFLAERCLRPLSSQTGLFHRGIASELCLVELLEPGIGRPGRFDGSFFPERCIRAFSLLTSLFRRGVAAQLCFVQLIDPVIARL